MAEEIRDVTVSIKLDTKDVDQKEAKTKQAFDKTNQSIETQTKLTAKQTRELEKLIKLQEIFARGGRSPEGLAVINKQIIALKKRGTVIKKATDQTKKLARETEKVNKNLNFFNNTLKNIGKSLLIAFSVGAVIAFGKATVRAFDEQAKAVARLRIALGGQEDTLKSLTRQAKELQSITIFSDQDVISAQALIAAFTDEEAIIKELTRVTLDFATAKGFDLPAAAELVSKTFASSTNALTRYGIQVIGAAGSTERLESITKNLDAAFRGQAEAAVVGAGNLQQLSNQFTDFQEILGGALIEGNFFISFLTALLEGINTLLDPARALGKELEDIVPFTDEQLEQFERGIRIEKERQKLLQLNVIPSQEDLKRIEERIDAEIFLEKLAKEEAEANKIRLNNLFEIKAAIKKLTEEQDAEGTTRQRIFEITQLLIPLEEERLILTGKQTKAAKELAKAQDELRKANKKFRDQVFKDIESAELQIENLQIENIENEFVRDIRRIEKNRERALRDAQDTLATDRQKKILLDEQQDKFDTQIIKRNEENAEKIKEIREKEKDDAIQIDRERIEAINALALDALSFFANIQQTQTNLRLANLEKQGLSEEEFEIRKREILRQSAEQQKSLAIFDIGIATAKAITEALAVPPAPNIVLAAIAAALGAAQLAVVATTPIPQFAEGTLDAPGGLAMTGEKGRELTYMPKGAKVLPHDKTEKYAGVIDSMFRNKFDQYIMERYVPDMLMTNSEGEIYNDHRLRGDVRNSRFNARDADRIGRSVAKHTSSRAYLMNRYA